MVRQLSLFDLQLPPSDVEPSPASPSPVSRRAPPVTVPPAHMPAVAEGGSAAAGGIPSPVVYRCYGPIERGDRIEQTVAAALAAFRARLGTEPRHIAAHPEAVATLRAATALPVLPQAVCPRGQVRLALP